MRNHPGGRRFATTLTLILMAAAESALIVTFLLFIYNTLN